ncbi:CAC [Symbiodinium sp. CCMP2456]|nr:CAC [Symbiodinium sp. CCMP2456]
MRGIMRGRISALLGMSPAMKTQQSAKWGGIPDMLDPRMPTESPIRFQLAVLSKSLTAEIILGLMIAFNVGLIIIEVDSGAVGVEREIPAWVEVANLIMLATFSLELIFKCAVYQSKIFLDAFHLIDAFVVLLDLSIYAVEDFAGMEATSAFSAVRLLRIIRILRAVRLLRKSRELSMLMLSFLASLSAVFWGVIMVIVMVTLWAILAVQLIHPINYRIWVDRDCERCPHAFESVWQSAMTLLQTVIAGDSWGHLALPILEAEPITLTYFAGVIVSVDLAMLNLILAVIVDSAQDARSVSDHERALQMEKDFNQATQQLYRLCRRLDTDNSGKIDPSEFVRGFEQDQDFADCLKGMGIGGRDLEWVLSVLDKDDSGDISPDEFVDQLYKLRTHETHQILSTLTDVRKLLRELAVTQAGVIMHNTEMSNWKANSANDDEAKLGAFSSRDTASEVSCVDCIT